MSLTKFGLVSLGIAAVPLVAIGAYWGLSGSSSGAEATEQAQTGVPGRRTVGGTREALLAELTRDYVSRGTGISAAMRSGDELAPFPFLNEQLEQRGIKWRVRSTDGRDADTYDVS